MTTLRFSAATHTGNLRDINEDRLLALPEQRVWIVADGMGGHDAGDFAAQTIVDRVADLPRLEALQAQADALQHAILDAHTIIRQASEAWGSGPIGATVAAFVAGDSRFLALWAGDSRLYRLRDQRLRLLTSDHSLVADLVSLGQLSWEQAADHPQSNVITRAVGADCALHLDTREGSLRPGDRFILCTDGLSGAIDLKALSLALREVPVADAADMLIHSVLAGEAADNIAVIVIDVV